jgi:hypothetical protein
MANLVTAAEIEAMGLSPASPALVDVAEPLIDSESDEPGDDDGDAG